MDPLNVAIVGCGRITDMHAPGYLRCPDARIHTLCDLDPDLLARRKGEWQALRTTTDYAAVLEDPDIDLVEIITPHHLHERMTIAACEAGKHVSVQKPMAMNVGECDRMITAAQQAGVLLKVFENFVFYPPYVKARQLIADGAIGEPLGIRLRIGGAMLGGWPVPLKSWVWRLNEETCGGGPTLFDDGYHKFSMAIELLGPVAEVHAWVGRTFGRIDSPAMVSFTFESGNTGIIEATLSPHMTIPSKYYAVDERVEITGSEGQLWVQACTSPWPGGPPVVLHRDGVTRAFEDLRHDWLDSFVDSTLHFVRCVREGGDPRLSGERGREVLQFVLAALQSAASGRPVRPDEVVS